MKSKYETNVLPYLPKIKKWIKAGKKEHWIAENLGISKQAWADYKRKYPDFLSLVRTSRANPEKIEELEESRRKLTTGYDVKEYKITHRVEKDAEGNVIKDITERQDWIRHIPANAGVVTFSLTHLCPEVYSEKKTEAEGEAETGVVLIPTVEEEQ